MPLLIGGGRRAAHVARRGPVCRSVEYLDDAGTARAQGPRCCARTASRSGRDPDDIHVSTQALLFLSADKEWLREKRQAAPGPPVIVGTPGEVADIVARYRDAGADELIIPDFTLGSMARKKDTCDLFMEEVAPAFR